MDLDRGTLARIDRKVLSGLGHDEICRMVRLPVSQVLWSAWKRYCDALGISMGRAIVALIEGEFCSVIDDSDGRPVFLAELEDRLKERQVALDVRERALKERERWLRDCERRIWANRQPPPPADIAKVGRNDPCPCRSGVKYKRCHGA